MALPHRAPQFDTVLAPAELITSVDLPPSPFAEHAHYLKVRERASYAFALISVAAAVSLRDGVVRQARLALGGVAHKPWRMPAAEALLIGQRLDNESMQRAADTLLAGAVALRDNAFKPELARRAVLRALRQAGSLT